MGRIFLEGILLNNNELFSMLIKNPPYPPFEKGGNEGSPVFGKVGFRTDFLEKQRISYKEFELIHTK